MDQGSQIVPDENHSSEDTLLVFAHVPPPDHGQSRMVAAMLEAIHGELGVIHVDARLSDGMEDVGSRRPGKMLRIFPYLKQALLARWRGEASVLYYIPGPVKWSAVIRDWVVLGVLRPFFSKLVLHWHAIGQGEWSSGSERVRIPGPDRLDRVARRVSAWILQGPELSIPVSMNSGADSRALGAWRTEVVCNGLRDPCSDYVDRVLPVRRTQAEDLATDRSRALRVLFLSRGTREKGVLDALEVLGLTVGKLEGRGIRATFVGGLEDDVRSEFETRVSALADSGLEVVLEGFAEGKRKGELFLGHDLMLSSSRWESFGLTVAESMAWGLPVVAAGSDGVIGVLPEGYAYLAPVGDLEGLSDRMVSCLECLAGGEGASLADLLRSSYVQEFGLDGYEERIRRVLSEV